MADLLECVIQIKALRHSIERIERLTAAAPAGLQSGAAAVVAALADAERAYARAGLGQVIRHDPAAPAQPLDAFIAGRRANLRALQAYGAADLGRRVEWPGRPGATVADLVAIMLARDTELIGELRRLLCAAGPIGRSGDRRG